MRVRAWVAIVAALAAIMLGFVGRATDADLDALAGLLWLAAIVLGLSLLAVWSRWFPPLPTMPSLFTAVGPGQRWCAHCGTPAEGRAPCAVCGHTPRPARVRKRAGGKGKVAAKADQDEA